MEIKTAVYNRVPERSKPFVRSVYSRTARFCEQQYRSVHPKTKPIKQLHAEFIDDIFDSPSEYSQYVREFENGTIAEVRDEALDEYRRLSGGDTGMGTISMSAARDYYAVTRKTKPDTVVETGVCNGLSTASILIALQKNECGELHSIDYPLRADESLEEFRGDTFEGYGGAAIPSDKDPGWIIPDELRDQWTLIVGKSQREFPKLVNRVDGFGLFIHDSEHSHPCMMFEYELAYEWLEDGGIILSDDITWNDAFDIFSCVREPECGRMSKDVGYMKKC